MSWAALFRAREYLKGSVWFYPLIGAILGPLLALLTQQADTSATVPKAWQYAPSTASTVLTTIVGATVGLAGFVVTVTVLAIQMATGTFSARYMRIWYRDRMLKATLTVLAVDAEIAKLDATVAVGFADSVDKDQAQARDRQGIGGPAASTASSRTAST